MRAVLVFDMPDVCDEDKCPLCYDGAICAYTGRRIIEGWGKPNSCPLRPLPHKLQADWYTDGYKEGFNACLDAITGETE